MIKLIIQIVWLELQVRLAEWMLRRLGEPESPTYYIIYRPVNPYYTTWPKSA